MEGLVLGLREGGHLKYGFCRHKRYHIGYSPGSSISSDASTTLQPMFLSFLLILHDLLLFLQHFQYQGRGPVIVTHTACTGTLSQQGARITLTLGIVELKKYACP